MTRIQKKLDEEKRKEFLVRSEMFKKKYDELKNEFKCDFNIKMQLVNDEKVAVPYLVIVEVVEEVEKKVEDKEAKQ